MSEYTEKLEGEVFTCTMRYDKWPLAIRETLKVVIRELDKVRIRLDEIEKVRGEGHEEIAKAKG